MGPLSPLRAILRRLRRRRPITRITSNGAGILVEGTEGGGMSRAFLAWDDVERAEAFKRDLVVADLICLELRADGEFVEVNEEMAGWDDLVAQMPERLPGALGREKLYAAVIEAGFRGVPDARVCAVHLIRSSAFEVPEASRDGTRSSTHRVTQTRHGECQTHAS